MAPRTLPIGLERMVFLLVPRKTAHTCLVVARLEPHLYWAARRFLMSMDHHPDFARTTVKTLCLNVSIRLDTAASILALTIYLPNVPIFHRITRLHLTNAWATWNPAGNSIGLEELKQLTHLSLHLSTVRMLPVLLRKILDRENLAVLVSLEETCANLKDERVLVLDDELLRHHMLDDNLWTSAEHVIKQRRDTEVTPSDGNDDVIMPYIAKPADPGFHSEVGWMVKTDEDPDGSGEGSEAESAKGSSLCQGEAVGMQTMRTSLGSQTKCRTRFGRPGSTSEFLMLPLFRSFSACCRPVTYQIVHRTKGSKLKSKSPSSLLEKVGYGCTRSSDLSADLSEYTANQNSHFSGTFVYGD
ncbi:hypothetical protein HD554DRAFT_2036060 [Boletus coccyginus]|nr:hypothetical protein HD554DRAFT_2036060 [Boletus coccyginus]